MSIMGAAHRTAGPGERINWDSSEIGWEVIRVEQGSGSLFHQTSEYALSEGTVVCVSPRCKYFIVPESEYMDIRVVISEAAVMGMTGILVLKDDEYGSVGKIMGVMRFMFYGDSRNYENCAASLQRALQDLLVSRTENLPNQELMDFIERMRDNIANAKFSVVEAMDAIPQTRSYTRRQFKEAFGMSPTAYMNQLRIGVAKLYLLTSTQTISEVAYAAGFRDAKYFARVFRQITGMTPTEFAEVNQQK